MKRLFASLSAFLFAVTVTFISLTFLYNEVSYISANSECLQPKIIIDPGHGGEDGGTSANDGTLEKDINLSVSRYLCSMLKTCGYSVVMTRETDEQIGDNTLPTIRQRKISDIKSRLLLTENNPDAILISIHQNHYSSPKYYGAQVFYSPNSPESPALAESIQSSIVSLLQNDNLRTIKKVGTDIYLLYNSDIPSVMVECGFMSNPDEAKKLKSKDYQKQMAFSIMYGIQKYLEAKNG